MISNNVPPITLRVTKKEVRISGQIKLLEEEKVSLQLVCFAKRQPWIVFASAIDTQIAKTILAAKTIRMMMLLASEEDGR